ncbi:MAG: hypothetical protein B6I20_13780 [Bacteroidetes bacterium 4572_117]|nr:MAG: hypothetical protein B6I20_13780 [Bacteroidetes bacterium 4572_117]
MDSEKKQRPVRTFVPTFHITIPIPPQLDFIKQLPTIKTGVFHKSPLPDYKKFKLRKYNTVADCVTVLIGERLPNRLYTYFKHVKSTLLKDVDDYNVDILQLQLEPDFQKATQGLNLLSKIKIDLVRGETKKEFKVIVIDELPEKDEFFSTTKVFHSLKFLDWMRKMGYPIPDELLFDTNEKGKLQYKDAIVFGEWKQTFPQHPKGKPLKEDPLYIAVKTREALMDGTIDRFHEKEKTILSIKREDRISKWIYTKYNISKYVLKHLRSEKNPQPKHHKDILSIEQVKYIFKIVNDGARS